MKPLVLTSGWPWPFTKGGFADLGLYSGNFRFIWGPPPSLDEIAAHLGPRTRSLNDASDGMHWSDWVGRWKHSENRKHCDLARGPKPAVSGLIEGPFDLDMHDSQERHARYKNSTLALTDLGKAILAGTDDFNRHNPIHRWWGGTELSSDNLWRWDPQNRRLIAP